MAAHWLWNATPIYVSEQEISREVKIAELFALDSTDSILHVFGAGSEHRTITGLVIGDTNKNAIIADAIAGTARTLTTPFGNLANATIFGTPKFASKPYVGGDIDGTAYSGAVTPIYECQLEVVIV